MRRGLFVAIALLYALSIPWYRDPDAPLRTVLGLPDWVAVALGCYVAVAVLNAIAWCLTDMDDPTDVAAPSGDAGRSLDSAGRADADRGAVAPPAVPRGVPR